MVLTDFSIANHNLTHTTPCGAPGFMAPEMVLGVPYTKAVDWWSYGAIIYQMVTGEAPFKSKKRDGIFQLTLECRVVWPPRPQVSQACRGVWPRQSNRPLRAWDRLCVRGDAGRMQENRGGCGDRWAGCRDGQGRT